MTTTPKPYLTYREAADHFNASVYTLQRLAAAGRLTRHQSAVDRRVTLLDTEELHNVLGDGALNQPA